jgi:hypothetical protein
MDKTELYFFPDFDEADAEKIEITPDLMVEPEDSGSQNLGIYYVKFTKK